MAIMDITHLEVLRNVFPELTKVQLETMILFSSGFLIKEIAGHRGISVQSVAKTLSECNKKYDVNTAESLRNIFIIRLLVRAPQCISI